MRLPPLQIATPDHCSSANGPITVPGWPTPRRHVVRWRVLQDKESRTTRGRALPDKLVRVDSAALGSLVADAREPDAQIGTGMSPTSPFGRKSCSGFPNPTRRDTERQGFPHRYCTLLHGFRGVAQSLQPPSQSKGAPVQIMLVSQRDRP